MSGVDLGDANTADIPFVVGDDVTVNVIGAYAGMISLVDVTGEEPPLTWNYLLTHQSGSVSMWSYNGAAITDASVDGDAQAAGWSVQIQTDRQVTFFTTTPLTSNSLTGFHITGLAAGVGPWTCGSSSGSVDGSLPVELSSFTAATSPDNVTLHWSTESEIGNAGFNVYRSDVENGKYGKLNTILILGAGTDASPHDYSFTDENADFGKKYFYYIEDVSFSGKIHRSQILEVTAGFDLIPTETVLLQNYPNPFNPETWIPFQLAESADVVISIYDASGQLIRKIKLGNLSAGVYVSQDMAAYWDGFNETGEKVSSGLYFYNLLTGKCMHNFRHRRVHSATKRMLILK